MLVVDEAQNLSRGALEELRMLSNLQHGAQPLLQSFLVGQPELKDILRGADMLQLQQRVIAAYHLGPLDAQDTRSYIEHRLRVVGWQDRPTITDDAYEEIYRQTGGVPRRINSFCDRLLLYGYLEELKTLSSEAVAVVERELAQELAPRLAEARPVGDAELASLLADAGFGPPTRYFQGLMMAAWVAWRVLNWLNTVISTSAMTTAAIRMPASCTASGSSSRRPRMTISAAGPSISRRSV